MTQLPPNYPPPGYPPPGGPPSGPPPSGPPPQQGWGPPGTATGWGPPYGQAQPPTKNRAPLVIAIVLAALAVVGALVLVLSQDDDGDSGSPTVAVERFIEADSCPALADATTASWQQAYLDRYVPPGDGEPAETFLDACQQVKEDGVTPIATGEDEVQSAEVASQDGDTAVVRATWTTGGTPMDSEYTVVRENGTWKVDQVGGSSDETAGSSDASPPELPDDGETPSTPSPGAGSHLDPDAPSGLAADPDANGDLPEDVVVNFFEAVSTGDCEQAVGYLTEEALTKYFGVDSEEEAIDRCLSDPAVGLAVDSAEFTGILLEPSPDLVAEGMKPNTAVVEAVANQGEIAVWLIWEDGLWKIY